MPDAQIFKATYSGIPVYELMCKGVAVMRRRSDSWLNATQILKVAGFDKPQRTRVLEREVQKGEHEKVQGGYGKYQGTWIPLERGLQLARQYNCESLLRPIIEFQPAAKSPPLAPKHLVSAPVPRHPPPTRRALPESPATHVTRSRKHISDPPNDVDVDDANSVSSRQSDDASMTSSPSRGSSSSRTPSPIVDRDTDHEDHDTHDNHDDHDNEPPPAAPRKRPSRRAEPESVAEPDSDSRSFGDQMLEYFISDSNQVPPVLIQPPPDFDPNIAIDDDGHTPLHWACAMGRIRIVKLLLTSGADIFKVNLAGQTPLMRAVMFANNYDVRKFPELYELLYRSTLNIDNNNRTVFHHIVDVAMSKGKTHAARYYMETVLYRLADYPRELADVINFQDEEGDTPLTLAARCRSKRLVKILIDHGGDPKIANNDGKTTEDYILEDERFRASPVPPSRIGSMSFRNAHAASPSWSLAPTAPTAPPSGTTSADFPNTALHHSIAGQKASTRCVNEMATLLDSLAASFDQELLEKERDMTHAQALLVNIRHEILESSRAVGHLQSQAEGLSSAKAHEAAVREELLGKMGRRYRLGWEKWVKDEENREAAVRKAAGGELAVTPATVPYRTDDSSEPEGAGAGEKRKTLPIEEDISDLLQLYTHVPTDEEALHAESEALREEMARCKRRRVETFEELVRCEMEAGTGGRMGEYRRLIGAGCGGVPPGEVDGVIPLLLETLEAEEPSASSMAWGLGSKLAQGVTVG